MIKGYANTAQQIKSAVFYQNNSEKKTGQKLIGTLKDKGYKIATRLIPAQTFWAAEEYHQNYYDRKREKPYCHIYRKKF